MKILQHTSESIFKILSEIPDPEIPVINIAELGILRSVVLENGKVIVNITPTYSGCPAMMAIEKDIKEKLVENNIENAEVKIIYSPVWTTDWMNEEAKEKLRVYGISPPGKLRIDNLISGDRAIACPRCGSGDVKLVSLFGSTACKALYKCTKCLEPFDQFKCH
jgi:ring-1,2-phenylacetyl-CoA epoxidase subunit PaaD